MGLWQTIWVELRHCWDLFLPPACLLCGDRLPSGAPPTGFCPKCHAGVPTPAVARCQACAVAFRTPNPSLHHCESCLRRHPPFARVHAVGPYAGTLREAIQCFKYRGQLPLERPLGRLLVETLRSSDGQRPELVIPVPLHDSRLRERGYNQALQLARQVGQQLAVPVAPDLLRRTRPTAAQQGLDAVARKNNLRGAFAVTASLEGQHVLLIDDVLTTGATARECARVLLGAGAASVEVAVLGRA